MVSYELRKNELSQCYEAWSVDPQAKEKRLLSTCSTCVSEQEYRWWKEMLRSRYLGLSGIRWF